MSIHTEQVLFLCMVVVENYSGNDAHHSLCFQDLHRDFECDKARGQKPSAAVKVVYGCVAMHTKCCCPLFLYDLLMFRE